MNNKSVQQMKMEATKRARVEREMVMATRLVGKEEGVGNKEDNGIGNEGGLRQRGQWQRLQEQ
jgi:hypothetical protein